jgi:hypothetical protein
MGRNSRTRKGSKRTGWGAFGTAFVAVFFFLLPGLLLLVTPDSNTLLEAPELLWYAYILFRWVLHSLNLIFALLMAFISRTLVVQIYELIKGPHLWSIFKEAFINDGKALFIGEEMRRVLG